MSTVFKIRDITHAQKEHYESFYCNMCHFPLFTGDDFLNYSNYKCCNECYLTFIESRIYDWKKGWRPNSKLLDNYIKNRKKILRRTQ